MAQAFHFQSILLPLTGAADAASVVAVAAVGKITGTEGNHSSAFCGRPSFFTAAVAAARCLVLFSRYYGAEICSLEPVHMLNRCRQFFCAHNLVSTSCGHRHVSLAFRRRTLSQWTRLAPTIRAQRCDRRDEARVH